LVIFIRKLFRMRDVCAFKFEIIIDFEFRVT